MDLNVLGLIKSVEAFENEQTEENRRKSIQKIQSKAIIMLGVAFVTWLLIVVIMSLM